MGSSPHNPIKSQNIGFLNNAGPEPLNNHKATNPAFNVGPSSARQRKQAFHWLADDCLHKVVSST